MTHNKVVTQSNNVNPVVAAVAGAVVAGVAVAGAYALSNKDNQDKVAKVVTDVKKNIMDKKDVVVGKAQKLEDIAKNTVNDVKNI
jgi:hypothetical protein